MMTEPVRRSRVAGITALTVFFAGAAFAAQPADRPIILKAPAVQTGDVFECRIPIYVSYEGTPQLKQLRVIAKAYDGDRELGSTGIATGPNPLLGKRVPGGMSYKPVPLQFDLTREICRRVDGLRIAFARCTFGDRPAEDCLGKIRFGAAPPDDPLFLPLG